MRDNRHNPHHPTRRQGQHLSPSPEIQVKHDTSFVGRPTKELLNYDSNNRMPLTRGKVYKQGVEQPKPKSTMRLPTSREEATWQLLDIFTNSTATVTTSVDNDAAPGTNEHERALKILRLYPELSKEPFYCRDKPVFGTVSWLPLYHFVSQNAPVQILKEIVSMNPFALRGESLSDKGGGEKVAMSITPLHVACLPPLCNNEKTIFYLANANPEALFIAPDPYGFPLHCLLHRWGTFLDEGADGDIDDSGDSENEREERDSNIRLLTKVLEQWPGLLSLYDPHGTGVLVVAILSGVHITVLECIVEQMIANGISELNLGEPSKIQDSQGKVPWAVQSWQVRGIARLCPQLHALKCTIQHWRRDGMIGFLESLPKATNLKSLHLDLPDDIHLEHWNGAALQTLHRALVHATSMEQTLQQLTISLYSRRKELGLLNDCLSGEGGGDWSHDKTFLAIVTALPSIDESANGISRLKLQNFHLQEPSHLGSFLASRSAPGDIELANLSLSGPWQGANKLDWKKSRVRHLTITGAVTPLQEEVDWVGHFMDRLAKHRFCCTLP